VLKCLFVFLLIALHLKKGLFRLICGPLVLKYGHLDLLNHVVKLITIVVVQINTNTNTKTERKVAGVSFIMVIVSIIVTTIGILMTDIVMSFLDLMIMVVDTKY
jgi:hypothetical protein